jgi:hypothetical protein
MHGHPDCTSEQSEIARRKSAATAESAVVLSMVGKPDFSVTSIRRTEFLRTTTMSVIIVKCRRSPPAKSSVERTLTVIVET